MKVRSSFDRYVEVGELLAEKLGVAWSLSPDQNGVILKIHRWNLNVLCGVPPTPNHYLADLGEDKRSIEIINSEYQTLGIELRSKLELTEKWQTLIKAAVLDQVVHKGSKPGHISLGIIRPLRVIATCCNGVEPDQISSEHVDYAVEIASKIQPSMQLASRVIAVVRDIFDFNELSACTPLLIGTSAKNVRSKVERKNYGKPRKNLEQRRRPQGLPDENALWELVRIVFTKKPQTFVDELRFAQIVVLITCGLRIGEVCSLPKNWKQIRSYTDAHGRPAGDRGGISNAALLNYFAEKKSNYDRDGAILYSETQYIPEIFEPVVERAMLRVINITQPLRKRLEAQIKTSRILPEYTPDDLVPVTTLFTILTGNPFAYDDPDKEILTRKYKERFDVKVLDDIAHRQMSLKELDADLRNEVRVYFSRMRRDARTPMPFRDIEGKALLTSDYKKGYFRVEDVETFIANEMPSKISDMVGFRSSLGPVNTSDLLFLGPKRSLVEERSGGICDVSRYCFVGKITSEDLMYALGGKNNSGKSLFERYGETKVDKQLKMHTHEFRHLQNTELFRLGVADTIITKRFGRKSIAQSYEYDHRSLAEELEAIDLPDLATEILGPKAQIVMKLVSSGKVQGKIVEEFKSIQQAKGDEVAFEFLASEADGFHTTPYGFCVNSFMVDPCPKHLECYDGCRHFATSELPEHRVNVETLKNQFLLTVKAIESRSGTGVGIVNQLAHAKSRLDSVEKILATPLGEKPFPDGSDLSVPIQGNRKDLFDV